MEIVVCTCNSSGFIPFLELNSITSLYFYYICIYKWDGLWLCVLTYYVCTLDRGVEDDWVLVGFDNILCKLNQLQFLVHFYYFTLCYFFFSHCVCVCPLDQSVWNLVFISYHQRPFQQHTSWIPAINNTSTASSNITPCSWSLFKKPPVMQPLKNFWVFYAM
jgi:hypothetical protein